MYGPLINLSEDANQGEGFLKFAKPLIKDIHTSNWNPNTHLKLLNGNRLDSMIKCHSMNKSSNTKKKYGIY